MRAREQGGRVKRLRLARTASVGVISADFDLSKPLKKPLSTTEEYWLYVFQTWTIRNMANSGHKAVSLLIWNARLHSGGCQTRLTRASRRLECHVKADRAFVAKRRRPQELERRIKLTTARFTARFHGCNSF